MAGGVEVAGDLEGEGAAGGEGVQPVGEAGGVAGDPLEQGVGDDEVVRLGGLPGGGVGLGEVEEGSGVGAGALQHAGRAVVAGDAGAGPAVAEERGDVARAAAEVGDAGCGFVREGADAGQEVVEGAGAVVRVTEVLLGVPAGRCHGVRITNRIS